MNNILSQIISGIIVALILYWIGLGSNKVIVYNSGKIRKTGKWIIIISILIIIIGLNIGAKQQVNYTGTISPGYGFAILGGFLFFIGKIIAWFQRN